MKQSASKVVLSLLLILAASAAFATERYSVRYLEQGVMYFFMPCKLKSTVSGTKLQYDMTLLSSRDSVSINMTLTSRQGRVKAVRLSAGDASYVTSRCELYFQERAGSRFNTRVHIDCPVGTYRQLFAAGTPLGIELTMEDGSAYSFTYKAKTWREEQTFVSEVLESIDYYRQSHP